MDAKRKSLTVSTRNQLHGLTTSTGSLLVEWNFPCRKRQSFVKNPKIYDIRR